MAHDVLTYPGRLTGRWAPRVGGLFRNKLILQVEVEVEYFDGAGGVSDLKKCWRDASITDLMDLFVYGGVNPYDPHEII